ncbi:peptidyl-prolyl cis-trans isomerase cyclophilin type [Segniliparus rotundus DSM 44985]|uniref:Peptidyl-prolyl cis-trans isomerase n=1 Tax=Segniliparus rotundus (strain ATCC BAA-972 / CDC 1076 / CIP 108378 / DSM 44985 / JCM 13578) TaxID=640132 RepID=D6Z7J2_SEGRD|nr:peptidylprolyl isomerase [Segniliparus rotundus]ADG97922.1 peptidyl-prolyl cis-trans isomerase cyclophilin type [Segniliparus rotundus DSM 44985]
MPNNEQKRAAAKRKLQRQLEKRAERQRRRLTLVFAVVVVLAVIAGGAFWWHTSQKKPQALSQPKPDASSCEFTASQQPPSKPATRPANGPAPTTPPNQDVTLKTDRGDIPLTLDRAKSPCAVQSFLSLSEQKFFNDTTCHRLTTGGIYVLQCGDPTGSGSGGPGYSFADEYPIPKDRKAPVASNGSTFYTRGTLAMANSGPDTNGSQFFLVYKDSPLPPSYTVFGHIADAGLAVLDKIAAGGVAQSSAQPTDGAPRTPVKITGVELSPAPAQPAPAGH